MKYVIMFYENHINQGAAWIDNTAIIYVYRNRWKCTREIKILRSIIVQKPFVIQIGRGHMYLVISKA